MRLPAALTVLLVAAIPAAAAPVPKERPKAADRLLGVWKLVKSSQGGTAATLHLEVEFQKDGKLFIRQGLPGANAPRSVREGTYKVEGEKIHYEISTPGSEKQETLTIKRLTDDELAFDDPDDIREEFRRSKPDDKK